MSRANVPVVSKPPSKTTVEEFLKLPEKPRCELIDGVVVPKHGTLPDGSAAGPLYNHSRSQGATRSVVGRRYDRDTGGKWPGGWNFATEVDVAYGDATVFNHDIAGWRRERFSPTDQEQHPITIVPDWVCEIVSPRNAKNDLLKKPTVLAAAAVPFYWLIYPSDRVLLVHRLVGNQYENTLVAGEDETIRAEPFDEVELRVATLFGADDDE